MRTVCRVRRWLCHVAQARPPDSASLLSQIVDQILLTAVQPAGKSEGEELLALGTLDALHLATLLLWRERMKQTPVLATRDGDLALAAQAFGVGVLGVDPEPAHG
jgi:hypothetical protein